MSFNSNSNSSNFANIFTDTSSTKPNTIVIPTKKQIRISQPRNPYIDLSFVKDLHKINKIELNNHGNGNFQLVSRKGVVKSQQQQDKVAFLNTTDASFPEYVNHYTYYSPKIYGTNNSPLLKNEHLTLHYKNGTKTELYSQTPKAFNLTNDLRYAVPIFIIQGKYDCKLLIDGEEPNYVVYTKRSGQTYITFNNTEQLTHNVSSGSSKYLTKQQLDQSVNFSRTLSVHLIINDCTIEPSSVNVRWWYYTPLDTSSLLNRFIE